MLGAQIAFRDYQPRAGIWNSPWVGFKHFIKFFHSYQFERVLGNTLILSFYSLAASFPLSILMALAINLVRRTGFKKFVQTVSYMPYFISVVVLVGILNQVLSPVVGIYGGVYRLFCGSGFTPGYSGKRGDVPAPLRVVGHLAKPWLEYDHLSGGPILCGFGAA